VTTWRGTRGLVAVAAAIVLAPGGHASASEPASHRVAEPAAQVREYWTQARMRAAEPAGLMLLGEGRIARSQAADRTATDASGANTGFPARAHGKVFFTIEGGSKPGDFVCSGTAVSSNSHTLVWTAGHCVNDAEFGGGFATNWEFVPGYRDGERPFGGWPAKQLLTTDDWRQKANVRVDLGAAVVARDAQGRGLEDVVGARGIAFGTPRQQAYAALGYPALPTLLHPEFDGERLYRCDSMLTASDDPPGPGPQTMEIDCDMTGGSSGGGWVIDGGRIASVVSYGYAGDLFHLYGPYQGQTAQSLYDQASGPPLLCAGRPVTNLGGPGDDAYTGTAGADTFKLAGGADRVTGATGNDRACGGGGGDQLRGEDGKDVIRGGSGRDLLIGGPGQDICDGGPGRDRARSCEQRKRVP
jgi:hypothetical protein